MGSSPLARGLPAWTPRQRPMSRIIPARAGFTGTARARYRFRADHPRSRGVYRSSAAASTPGSGSSPLARGLLGRIELVRDLLGIIPARAGFTVDGWALTLCLWDHPRSRGVYGAPGWGAAAKTGSSPLARGLRGNVEICHDRFRIIPARAGFTTNRLIKGWIVRDHPRSRGVYSHKIVFSENDLGSSPLARGLHVSAMVSNGLVRIIPARAGFTWYNPPSAPLHPDHPRSRGVYVQMARSCVSRTGSSPLARGLLLPLEIRVWDGGIIPARAGFTGVGNIQVEHFRDHPRSRGVYSPDASPRRTPRGSSPLARGLPRGDRWVGRGRGIIPARAGFTPLFWPSSPERKDHPRSRGVYWNKPGVPSGWSGSSPLARGLPHRGDR